MQNIILFNSDIYTDRYGLQCGIICYHQKIITCCSCRRKWEKCWNISLFCRLKLPPLSRTRSFTWCHGILHMIHGKRSDFLFLSIIIYLQDIRQNLLLPRLTILYTLHFVFLIIFLLSLLCGIIRYVFDLLVNTLIRSDLVVDIGELRRNFQEPPAANN